MNNYLSVVIPCKNEGHNLIKTIDSIRKWGDFKVIVSDCSTDNTIDMLLEKYPEVTVTKGGLPSIARNNGALLVETDYILFVDADMDLSGVNLNEILKNTIEGDLHLTTCKITVARYNHKIQYFLFSILQKIISRKTPFSVGGFMLFKTSEFRRLKGFNENDKFAEDYHLSMKVDPKKFKIFGSKALTSDRRLENKSTWYMAKLMTQCWINRNNDSFYTKDHNYWD